MSKIKKMEGKLLLFLVAAIGILCAGFIVVGCGSGSSLKVADPFAAATALDFTDCPITGACMIAFASDHLANEGSIGGKELTLEAWIMPKGTSSATIFSRMAARGAALSGTSTVGGIFPKFTIRRVIESPQDTTGTSTVEYSVTSPSPYKAPENVWTHVAGVLTVDDHSGVHSAIDCADKDGNPTTGNQEAHLDIYVNGVLRACATTMDSTNDTAAHNDCIGIECLDLSGILGYAHNPGDNTMTIDYNGAIDETRLWVVDRTEDKILTCKGRELEPGSGDCGRNGTGLIAYQRYNEGEGYSVADFGGIGPGTKEYADGTGLFPHWTTGWVAGAPITPAD